MNPSSVDIKDLLVEFADFEFGVDLFISQQPPDIANCVTIYDVSSTPPAGTVSGNSVFFYETIQIIITHETYSAAHLWAQAIISLLHNRANFVKNETFYLYVNLISGPDSLHGTQSGQEQTMHTLSLDFNLQRKATLAASTEYLTFLDLVNVLQEGDNITFVVDSVAKTITISAAGGGGGLDWDELKTKFQDTATIEFSFDDEEEKITANFVGSIPGDISELTDNFNLLFDGDYNSLDNRPSIIPEAPIDGNQYARKDADWEEVAGGGSSLEVGRTITVESGVPASADLAVTDVDKLIALQGDDDEEVTDLVVNKDTFSQNDIITIRQSSVGYFEIVPEDVDVTILGGATSWGIHSVMTLFFLDANTVFCTGGQEV